MRDVFLFNPGRLKRKDFTIQYINEENQKKNLPIEQLENIHVFSELDLNTSFLNLLSQSGVCLHTYNYYGYYAGSYIPRKKQVSGYVDLKQAQYCFEHDKRIYIAQQFIFGSVHHILRNLRQHKAVCSPFILRIEEFQKAIKETKDIQTLMGIEGNIRQTYYGAFNSIIKNDKFHMTKREKRPPNNPINALISFGNSLMYTTVLSELYKTQLNPTISFLHEPCVKRYSLSLDISEIFKPLIIDRLIFSLINNRMIKENDFQWIDENICMLNENGKKRFLLEYEKKLSQTVKHRKLNRKVSYRFFIRLECYKLIKHFIGEDAYKPLKAWW
ncbi:type I-B CRISPR-associated endonuclease Cas1b [Bacillus pseudomycoides]|uniref:type I-B CRISPR-associated endonuclease Cas1b n=3 Tax=Bacillus pseudomycoides TaxID=64104 RepID=UPI0026CC4AC3|nr:type I-B CRISPR-associated endonuclease Cas1b [Bacillus pseudomycoides]